MLFGINGLSKELIYLTDVAAQTHVYTDDGLYVDWLFNTRKEALGPDSLTVEHFTGLVANHPETGVPYYFAGSTEDARVWRITGYDQIQRREGTFTLNTAGPLQRDEPEAPYTIKRTRPARKEKPGDVIADGFLNEPQWNETSALPIVQDGVVRGKLYLRHDGEYLHVGAHVWDESPAANSATAPEPAFVHGDAIDLYFGARGDTSSQGAARGKRNVRLLLAPIGEPNAKHSAWGLWSGMAVMYRPHAPDADDGYVFQSPVGKAAMDSVRGADGESGKVTFFRWQSGFGYTCEARLPLDALPELGLTRKGVEDADNEAHTIAFDAGILLSDQGGNETVERLYWQQDHSGSRATFDLPTEARLFPDCWGAATVQR